MTENDLFQDYTAIYQVIAKESRKRSTYPTVCPVAIGVTPSGWCAEYPAGLGDPCATLNDVLLETGLSAADLEHIPRLQG
jgi:hypothetical protein